MTEVAVLFFGGDRKEEGLRDAIGEIFLDLFQSRRNAVTNIAAQSGDWLILRQPFNHKEWLNQLRAVKLSLRAQIAQVLGTSQAHQALHHSDISLSHCADSGPGAVVTGSAV